MDPIEKWIRHPPLSVVHFMRLLTLGMMSMVGVLLVVVLVIGIAVGCMLTCVLPPHVRIEKVVMNPIAVFLLLLFAICCERNGVFLTYSNHRE